MDNLSSKSITALFFERYSEIKEEKIIPIKIIDWLSGAKNLKIKNGKKKIGYKNLTFFWKAKKKDNITKEIISKWYGTSICKDKIKKVVEGNNIRFKITSLNNFLDLKSSNDDNFKFVNIKRIKSEDIKKK